MSLPPLSYRKYGVIDLEMINWCIEECERHKREHPRGHKVAPILDRLYREFDAEVARLSRSARLKATMAQLFREKSDP